MQIIYKGQLHEISKPVFWDNNKNNKRRTMNLSSAEIAHRVEKAIARVPRMYATSEDPGHSVDTRKFCLERVNCIGEN